METNFTGGGLGANREGDLVDCFTLVVTGLLLLPLPAGRLCMTLGTFLVGGEVVLGGRDANSAGST